MLKTNNFPGSAIGDQSCRKAPNVSRRTFISLLAGGTLSGCADSPVLVNAYDALKYLTIGMDGEDISRQTVNNIPYASISAKIGKGPRSLLVLGDKLGSDLYWYSADNAVLTTRNGRIMKTAGFPENIKNTVLGTRDPVNRKFHQEDFPRHSQRIIDLDTGNNFGIPITSQYTLLGPRKISISEIDIETVLVKEFNSVKTVNWSFTNYYWSDIYDGFIWKSRQHISRSFDPVEIEVLKPAA